MRHSQMLIPTLKEDPADAQVVSHKLMLRAGLIRKVAAGIYNYLPLGLRVIQKVSNIVREEMNRTGAQEILMPMVLPAELWQESGRWGQYGAELLRLKDRKQADFCLGPTHEEVVTALVRDQVKSYRQLPITLYQVQGKFRDEIRPRFGLMRGREFIMKDAYSFGVDQKSALATYDDMYAAYTRIFERCGLKFQAVEADTGSIGGNRSHEFQVLADTGEDLLATCGKCNYAANVELAHIWASEPPTEAADQTPKADVATPGKKTIADVADFLGMPEQKTIKSIMFWVDEKPVMALCRGDHQVNEAKLKKALGTQNVRLLADAEIAEVVGPIGFLGPFDLKPNVRVIADHVLKGTSGMVAGATRIDMHVAHVAEGRDYSAEFFDLHSAQEGDRCGRCGTVFSFCRGIEVGHVFYLGTKYSAPMNATFLDEGGQEQVMEMGCYGIGVGRTAAAAIEQNHDEKGILWPMAIAPFQVALVRLGQEADVVSACDDLYRSLNARGIEVLYDDRDERPGVKFADHDLIGCPLRITVGGRSLKEGLVEVKKRSAADIERIVLADVVGHVAGQVEEMLRS